MVVYEGVFEYTSKNVTPGDMVSDLEFRRVKVPLDLPVQSLGVDTT